MNARYSALTTNRAMILEHPVLTHYKPCPIGYTKNTRSWGKQHGQFCTITLINVLNFVHKYTVQSIKRLNKMLCVSIGGC